MIGTSLAGRYTVVSELGRGGMGVVYRARDGVLSRDVAVKLVPPQLVGPATRERFQREAQLVARLDHPAIIAIHDFGDHEGSLFLVMPVEFPKFSIKLMPRKDSRQHLISPINVTRLNTDLHRAKDLRPLEVFQHGQSQ